MKTLLITGASSGIGAATARAAASAGWRVALAARSADALDALAAEIGSDKALAIACDVADPDEVQGAVDATIEAFGQLDAVFANAGLGASAPGTAGGEIENWRTMIDVNCFGLVVTVKAALPHIKASRGHVLLTGSQAGRVALSGSVYSATKWFVQGYGYNLKNEVQDDGVRVTIIEPGMVETPFFDEPKPGALRDQDIADAVVFALNQPARVEVHEIRILPLRDNA